MLDLHIHATDAKSLQDQLRDLAAAGGMHVYSDEVLLSELRQRMAPKGFVVKVVSFEDEGTTGTTAPEKPASPERVPAADKKKPGRPKNPETQSPSTAPEMSKEEPKGVEPTSDTAKAMAETVQQIMTDAVKAPTIDDVKAALNAFAGIHGQMKAREKIQSIGKSVKLMDVPADKYAELIAALAIKETA